MYCQKCLYELRGIESGACPECGRAFDADDPTTFKTEAAVAKDRSRGISAASAVTGGVLGAVASSLIPIDPPLLRATVGAIAGMTCGILTGVIVGRLWRERKSAEIANLFDFCP